MNLQPSEAEAGFDIRVPPLDDVDDLQRRIEDWAPASRNLTYSVICQSRAKPVLVGNIVWQGKPCLYFSRSCM